MLEQHLDKGGEWAVVDEFTVERGLFNYEYLVELNQRADAVLVYVTLPNFKPTWRQAGVLVQYWETDGEIYQTVYDSVRLQDRQVVEIQPLANSVLVFRPVEWLSGWSIQIRARLAPLSNRDILNQIVSTQQLLIDALAVGENDSGTDEEIAIINTKLDIIYRHLGLDRGTVTEKAVYKQKFFSFN